MDKQTIEALKMSIETMYDAGFFIDGDVGYPIFFEKAIKACEKALAEAGKQEPVKEINLAYMKGVSDTFEILSKQEPVGYVTDSGMSAWFEKGLDLDDGTPLYTHPATWQSLSDDEINEYWYQSNNDVEGVRLGFTTQQHYFARAIEQALKEKNHG